MHHQVFQRKQVRLLEQVLLRGLMILVVATALKTGAAITSGATGLYADALAAGLITAGGVMSLSRLQRTGDTRPIPANRLDLGYARLLCAMMTLGAVILVFTAGWRLYDPKPLMNPVPSLLLAAFGTVFHLSLAVHLHRRSRLRLLDAGTRPLGYGALDAVIVIAAVAAAFWTGWEWLDSFTGLAQAALLLFLAFQLWRWATATTSAPLPPTEQEQLKTLLDQFAAAEQVSFDAGDAVLINGRRHLSPIMSVPADWTIVQAQRCADAVAAKLLASFPHADVEIRLESQEDPAGHHSAPRRSAREDFRG